MTLSLLLFEEPSTSTNLIELFILVISGCLTLAVGWGARTLTGLLKSNIRIESRLFGDKNGVGGMVQDVEMLKKAATDREVVLYGHAGTSGLVHDVENLTEWRRRLEVEFAIVQTMAGSRKCPHPECPLNKAE